MLLLLMYGPPFNGPHAGPGHFPGFFFCGPVLFWSLLLGTLIVVTVSRRAARPAVTQRAEPSADGATWPELDPEPSAPSGQGPRQGPQGKVDGKIERF